MFDAVSEEVGQGKENTKDGEGSRFFLPFNKNTKISSKFVQDFFFSSLKRFLGIPGVASVFIRIYLVCYFLYSVILVIM